MGQMTDCHYPMISVTALNKTQTRKPKHRSADARPAARVHPHSEKRRGGKGMGRREESGRMGKGIRSEKRNRGKGRKMKRVREGR